MFERLLNLVILDPFRFIDSYQGGGRDLPRSPDFRAVTTTVVVAVMLCFMNFIVLDPEFQSKAARQMTEWASMLPDGDPRDLLAEVQPLYRHVSWSLGCTLFYFVIPALVVWLVYREPLSNYGFSMGGFFRHLPIYLGFYVIVAGAVVVVSYTEAFRNTYPFYHEPMGLWDLWIWEFFYCLQFFALEFFFRGFMIHSMKHRIGSMAVFAMVVPYCMIHFQKPFAEALAAIVAGTVLGVLSLRTSTMWGGVFIHSAVAITMDWASLIQRGWRPI